MLSITVVAFWLVMSASFDLGQLLLGMLQGAAHFRCLIGLQQGLPAAERERLIEAAVTLFLEGHRP